MLASLLRYYDCLCQQNPSPLTPKGFSKVSVSYNLVLNSEGSLTAILPYTQQVLSGKPGKEKSKDVPREVLLPFRNSIPGIAAETIDHREKYIFGLDYQKSTKTNPGKLIHTENSQKAFDKCKEVNLAFLDGLDSPVVNAYRLFLEQWVPAQGLEHPLVLEMDKNFAGAKFVISLEITGDLLHSDSQVIEKWNALLQNKPIEKDSVVATCALTGQHAPVARIHNNLKNIQGGMATGTNLVCFKTTAFESYGKQAAYNSSISQDAMERYTEAFNFLSASRQHKQVIDGTTFLFWAMTKEPEAPMLHAVSQAMGMSFDFDDAPVSTEELAVNTVETGLKSTFKALPNGLISQYHTLSEMTNVEFYIAAVRPNTSRLAVKLFSHSTFAQVMHHADIHQYDMRLHDSDSQLSLWQMTAALKSPVSNGELPPDLNIKILQSILNGTPYPRFMLDTAVTRWKVDSDDKVYPSTRTIRTRIIKGCLIRQHIIEREDFPMLNTETLDSAYNCGRLFAALEAVQSAALPGINATIKDKFFASACATPYLVFPRLVKLSQNHLSKIGGGLSVHYDKLLTQIMSNLDTQFPKALSMEKQGMFILGYYQQKEALFTKKEEK